ncbi:phosphatidylserine decarboxylase [uncultured Tenacibaculum sp.]|uniref:phosphatidylserine decarboxylase n=1 Tax=uncultured Tenacibaculum sp. TaxID=174713 RepID=UPI00262FD556|nr:phosphatidylserine decarboxylase [uncultured Tenacibaculum sp.]
MENVLNVTDSTTKLNPVVQKLKTLLDTNLELKGALSASLIIASGMAKEKLDSQLYNGLNQVFKGNAWPTTIEKYYEYLDMYVKLVPNEETSAEYPDAWKSGPQENGYNQKVYDLLCQFYWLVDQNEPGSNVTIQSFPEFSEWLVDFANSWGEFCSTTASFTEASKASFKANLMYNWDLYADNEASWDTFNKFFYREFNGAAEGTKISPLRPITDPTNNKTIVAPADCTFKADYPIDANGNVLDERGEQTSVNLKHTHSIGSVTELLDGSEYADAFNGGTFVHYFLGPFDYHRFHTPVSGYVLESRKISGKVYLNVELNGGQWHAPDGAGNGYEFKQSRGLIIMDTVELGKVAILPIGMCQVSGVLMTPGLQGREVVKGQEFGKFQFGGSDIIMLFEKSTEDLYMFKNDPGHNPIHFQYGQAAILAK